METACCFYLFFNRVSYVAAQFNSLCSILQKGADLVSSGGNGLLVNSFYHYFKSKTQSFVEEKAE